MTSPNEGAEKAPGISFEKPKEKGPEPGGQGEWIVQSSMASDAAAKKPTSYPPAFLSHMNLGKAYAKVGDWNKAVREFLSATKVAPNEADGHLQLGLVYQQQGHLDN